MSEEEEVGEACISRDTQHAPPRPVAPFRQNAATSPAAADANKTCLPRPRASPALTHKPSRSTLLFSSQ